MTPTGAASRAGQATRAATRVELGLAGAVLFVLTGGPSAWLTQRFTTGGPDFEQWPYQYPFGLAGLVGAGLLGSRAPALRSAPARVAAGALAGFVAWSLLSVAWSVVPHLTSSRALTSVGVACFAVWFGTALSGDEQRRAVAGAMVAVVAASAVLVAAVPSYGRGVFRDPTGGRFRGLAPNPNSLGPLCVLAGITFVASAWSVRGRRPVAAAWLALALVSVVLLAGSRSETAIATAVFALVVLVALAGARALQRRGVAGAVVGGGVVVLLAVGAVVVTRWFWTISEMISGDATFGHRRSIWVRVGEVIEQRPWRGWGYWAYWNVTGSGAVVRYGSAHNSALEVLLGLGVVGLTLFGTVVVLALAGVSGLAWRRFDPPSVWLAVVVWCLVAGHITESFVLWYSYNWVLVAAAAIGTWHALDHRSGWESSR